MKYNITPMQLWFILALAAFMLFSGCGTIKSQPKQETAEIGTQFMDPSSGWKVVNLHLLEDGGWLVQRYEPKMGWHSLSVSKVGTVSTTLLMKAQGVCYMAVEPRKNRLGIYTVPILYPSKEACDIIEDLFDQMAAIAAKKYGTPLEDIDGN